MDKAWMMADNASDHCKEKDKVTDKDKAKALAIFVRGYHHKSDEMCLKYLKCASNRGITSFTSHRTK
jgi:hypothetical protein